jgi:hypothetical protein
VVVLAQMALKMSLVVMVLLRLLIQLPQQRGQALLLVRLMCVRPVALVELVEPGRHHLEFLAVLVLAE